MRNYLLEVGTENLPVDFQDSAKCQIIDTLSNRLKDERLDFENIDVYYTPRRLALIITGLSEKQTDEIKKVKGPPATVAFKDGKPTPAAEGFCKKNGITIDKIMLETFGNTEYVVAEVEENGKESKEVLQNILPEIILNLKGSHFMRWEDLDVKFSRPIRWLTSVIDEEALPIKIADVESSKNSYGHRFLAPKAVEITSPANYKEQLKQAFVFVEPAERKEIISKQINAIAEKAGGKIVENNKLLNCVNNLAEWPIAALGNFELEYLKLPKELIMTVLSAHQKYFSVQNNENKGLLNHFICINNNGDNIDGMIKGNQRVLKARLEDAAFYYHEDTKEKLETRIEGLKGMTFQKGLGSIYDKTLRIKCLAGTIADQLNLSDEDKKRVLRASELCKADLITFMVREFTELEGIIGKEYSLKDGEDPLAAQAIGEHYLPRSVDDKIPQSNIGIALSIADKIDTITSVFSIGKSPTGSADPLGLRRAALGIIIMILNTGIKINITDLLEKNCDSLNVSGEEKIKLVSQVKDFIIQRFRIYLNDFDYRYDSIEAVLSSGDPLADITDVIERLKAVDKLVKEENFTPFHETANRLLRMIKNLNIEFKVKKELLSHESEIAFNEALDKIDTRSLSYDELAKQLKELVPTVENFFNDILVMDKDENIKNNRLSLVHKADQKYKNLADFSKVVD